MKAGRNDPCPCGSGKKFKKCCLGKNREASATSPSALSATAPNSDPMQALRTALAKAKESEAKLLEPPPRPRTPAEERADNRWDEFEASEGEGRIAVFLRTVEDKELMTAEMAYEMLSLLHSDAMNRGVRSRYAELVRTLRERLPDVYEKEAHYFLSNCLLDALAEGRLEVVPSLAKELAGRAGRGIDLFDRSRHELEYHGQLSALVEAFRIAWPNMKSSDDILPWAMSEFMNFGADCETFEYLEHTSTPEPADPVLLERVKLFVEEPREDYLREFIADLSGTSLRQLQAEEFVMRPPPKKKRDWDDDFEEGKKPADPGAINLLRLIDEFVGYLAREENVPYPRGNLVRHGLRRYFFRRHEGDLDPRPSMLELMDRPQLKLPKPPKPAHPLCPENVTLEVYLSGMMGMMNLQYHTAAALFQAMPAWLRFLERRQLIDAELRRKVLNGLLPMHDQLLKLWKTYIDDPTLYRQQQAWPADAAREADQTAR